MSQCISFLAIITIRNCKHNLFNEPALSMPKSEVSHGRRINRNAHYVRNGFFIGRKNGFKCVYVWSHYHQCCGQMNNWHFEMYSPSINSKWNGHATDWIKTSLSPPSFSYLYRWMCFNEFGSVLLVHYNSLQSVIVRLDITSIGNSRITQKKKIRVDGLLENQHPSGTRFTQRTYRFVPFSPMPIANLCYFACSIALQRIRKACFEI